MPTNHEQMSALDEAQVQQFIEDGFIRLDHTFPRDLADEGRELLWRDTGCDPYDPKTWRQPVIRLGEYGQEPFRQAVNMPLLHTAFDQLVGAGRWLPRSSLGTFPIRFPSSDDPGDVGWHAEASFAGADGSWRLNVKSQGRALLMLFLFSDVGDDDAPTRIRAGSHFRNRPPLREEGVKKLGGRASWRAVAPASPCPIRLGGSLALPISVGFEFFHTFTT